MGPLNLHLFRESTRPDKVVNGNRGTVNRESYKSKRGFSNDVLLPYATVGFSLNSRQH